MLLIVFSVLLVPACGKNLTTEEAEKLLRDAHGAQHDVMCSYTFDKVATLPGYSLNSDKDKCGEKLRRAGLAELGQFLEASDAREHLWESIIQAKSPARMDGVTLSFPCATARFAGIVGVSQNNKRATITYRETIEPREIPADVYARCEIPAPTSGPKEQKAEVTLKDDETWQLKPSIIPP